MIEFTNKDAITEWLVALDNNVTLLKAHIECEERLCSIVDRNTDGFVHRSEAMNHADAVKNIGSMIKHHLEKHKGA